jgi:hypothetical protein
MHEIDAAFGAAIEASGAFDLPGEQIANRLVHPSAMQPLAVDAEHRERILR